ncbi:Stp1/IreP family PP2C-type Ser/Thr phosphatase [Simiduia aestuariiviva]|uniref:Protein phosphatase n=1 Tax=Simiduia aestuariiviva TaxID=1510459 RepID=A0A839UK50_9GAMM|nr:Stp1/IreP family PP2C-type Ser/Thr phosphatase [Simiduia aestuariiviva]MBB3167993.1 protein phosphatase [Simiduia aestuariiviva]
MKPAELIRLAINGRTDIGQVRNENEDHIGWQSHPSLPFGFVVIADGMGGYTGGSTASQLAVTRVSDCLESIPNSSFISCTPEQQLLMLQAAIMDALNAANSDILNAKAVNPQLANMGSTIVLAVVWNNNVTIAHLGDSRAYLWNRDGLVQLTRDHSLVQEMIDNGSLTETQARSSKIRNHITRALGVTEFIEPNINSYALTQNTLLMLCSDGLTEYMAHDELEFVLSTHRPALECCYRFISEANESGGKDNISVGIIEYTVQSGDEKLAVISPSVMQVEEDVTVRKTSSQIP